MPGEHPPKHRVNWSFDEIVLVCDAVVENGWKAFSDPADVRVLELSTLLRAASPDHAEADPTFRNPNGVKRKSQDLITARPDYTGRPTKGGETTIDVVKAFEKAPAEMQKRATEIRIRITR